MKKALFLILIIFLFSCTKDETKEKETCWTCTTMKKPASGQWSEESSFETCEEGVKLLWDGKIVMDRAYADGPVTYVHMTTCVTNSK